MDNTNSLPARLRFLECCFGTYDFKESTAWKVGVIVKGHLQQIVCTVITQDITVWILKEVLLDKRNVSAKQFSGDNDLVSDGFVGSPEEERSTACLVPLLSVTVGGFALSQLASTMTLSFIPCWKGIRELVNCFLRALWPYACLKYVRYGDDNKYDCNYTYQNLFLHSRPERTGYGHLLFFVKPHEVSTC